MTPTPNLIDRTVLIALGGNALSPSTGEGSITEQFAHTRESLRVIMPFVRQGYRVAITHGNGPQVGEELLRIELSLDKVPALPLGVAVAATQGTIGYMIEQTLQNALLDEDIHRDVVSLITQVIVSESDPALKNPTKFIGHSYTKDRAEALAARFGWKIKQHQTGMWRRVVPSPKPLRINNARSIRQLLNTGSIVIASGGGGIPAFIMSNGHFEGVDAVIDKDLAGAILGQNIGAQELYILTDVDAVYTAFGTENQQRLPELNATRAEQLLASGEFPAGSMGPKIEAAVHFLKQGGGKVIITDIASVDAVLKGNAGTVIIR